MEDILLQSLDRLLILIMGLLMGMYLENEYGVLRNIYK